MVIAQVLCEHRDGAVELAAARAPDQSLLDERVAVHGYASLVVGAVGLRDGRGAVGRRAEGGHGGEVALLGVGSHLKSRAKKLRARESVTISRTASTSSAPIGPISAWFQSSRPYSWMK